MRYNDYSCEKCGTKTITRNEDSVTTPMFFDCKKCGNYMARSNFFTNDKFLASMQDHPEAKATHEFYYEGNPEINGDYNERLRVRELK